MLVLVVVVTILQVWLLSATMHVCLRGDESAICGRLSASARGLASNVGLFAYLRRLERTSGGGA
jgi:hypothetical protein